MPRMDVLDQFKAMQRAGWAHFSPLQTFTTVSAAALAKFAGIEGGRRVLDVACGTGVVAVTAARAGATVTGLDLTPELLALARQNARIAGVEIDFHEGDVEALPFDSSSFDVVVSQFGHMFAPRPEVAIGEMLRVLRPGGTIAFSTWPVDGYVARSFGLTARYMPPPPPGIAPPTQWGDEAIVRARLGSAVRNIEIARDVMFASALSLAHHRELIEQTAGPIVKLVATLGQQDPQKLAALRKEFDTLAAEYYADNVIRQEFLMTRAEKI
jgi:SAM-dependent methyltransferase